MDWKHPKNRWQPEAAVPAPSHLRWGHFSSWAPGEAAIADDASIVVYQAYRPAIADFAVKHQRFGGEFSYHRMSWIKPNFLWMMFRAGWATKEGQERILAVRLRRGFFDDVLRDAVPSSFDPARHASHDDWKAAIETSDVRLQWDPDHDPSGRPLARRVVDDGVLEIHRSQQRPTAADRHDGGIVRGQGSLGAGLKAGASASAYRPSGCSTCGG